VFLPWRKLKITVFMPSQKITVHGHGTSKKFSADINAFGILLTSKRLRSNLQDCSNGVNFLGGGVGIGIARATGTARTAGATRILHRSQFFRIRTVGRGANGFGEFSVFALQKYFV
jgi:hypothetical protein